MESDMKQYYVYIVTNHSKTLYTGVTNDLKRRVSQHQQKTNPGFTARYHIGELVFYEVYNDIRNAIAREKQIKGWTRARKIALIEESNPGWQELYL